MDLKEAKHDINKSKTHPEPGTELLRGRSPKTSW